MLLPEPGERRYDERTTVTRQRSERPTLAEVARAAGVSRATVSKVLNGRHDVSSETRTHVEQLLAEHSYVRRSAARDGARAALTTGNAIDLVVDTLVSPYTLEVIRGVSEAAEEAGMEVVLSRGAGNGDGGRWAERVTVAGRQGIILVTWKVTPQQREALRAAGTPLVLIDPLVVPDDLPSIGVTNWAGGLAATEHLIELGHRRIGVLAGPAGLSNSVARVHGFRAALGNAGLPVDPELIRHGDFGFELAREHAREMLRGRRPPSALFATSDAEAFGAIAAARECGLAVPADLSVVGFDGLPIAEWAAPPLTTIQTPMTDMGRMAVRTIGRLAGGGEVESMRVELATRLVVRESTGPPRPESTQRD
jgi:LacI family transcriptional regulator